MKNILKMAVFSTALLACEKVIDVDVPFEKPKMVMNTVLNPDSAFTIHISESQFILDNASLKDIADARVSIYNGMEKIGEPQYTHNGNYVLSGEKPEVGKTYHIIAERAGMGKVQGEETTLPSIKVVNTNIDTMKVENGSATLSFEFEIEDPAAIKNNYLIYLFSEEFGYYDYEKQEWLEDKIYWRPMNAETPDPSLEKSCLQHCGYLLRDTFFDGKNYKVKLNADSFFYKYIDPDGEEAYKQRGVYLAVFNISESAYLYYKTLNQNMKASGDPFAEPAKVFTNIEGGYGALTAMTPVYIKLNP